MRRRKLNPQAEALAVWRALEPQVVAAIRRETADCVRQKKLTVVTAPNGSTMGVMQPNDTTVFQIPYVSTLANVPVGTMVLAQYFYGMTNMIAVALGDGQTPAGGGAPFNSQTVTLSASAWAGAEAPFTQTVSMPGASPQASVLASPATVEDRALAGSAGVGLQTIGNGMLTFVCTTKPTQDILYNAGIL